MSPRLPGLPGPRARLAALAAMLALLAGPAAPRDASAGGTAPAWRLITRADGLPSDDVLSICVAGGTLWVGTSEGLARREDGRWTAWTVEDGLPFAAITAIDVDPETRDAWLGTWGGGLVRFTAGRFDRFDEINSGLAGNLVLAVRVQGQRAWAATNGGLSAFDWVSGTWELHLERRAAAPETVVTSLATASNRMHAAAFCEGILRVGETDEDPAEAVAPIDGASLGLVTWRDELLVSTPTRLLRRTPDGTWTERAIPRDPAESSWALAVSDAGRIWLVSGTSLLELPRMDGDGWLRHDFAGGAAAQRLRAGRPAGRPVPAALSPPDFVGRIRCLAALGERVLAGTARGLLESVPSTGPLAPSVRLEDSLAPQERGTAVTRPDVIGLLGPFGRSVSLPGGDAEPRAPRADERAVLAAIRQVASRPAPAVRKEPPGFVRYAWGLPEDEMIDTIRAHAPRLLLGCLEPDQRIASAVTIVTELPLVNVATTHPSDDELASPWIFRCPSNDPRAQARFIDLAHDALRWRRPAILRAADALDDLRLGWWSERSAARGAAPVAELEASAPGGDPAALAARLRALEPDVLLTCGEPTRTGELVRRLREAGFGQPMVVGESAVTRAFLEAAGPEPGIVVAPWPCDHVLDRAGREAFSSSHDAPPAPLAWTSYDATRHAVEALERAGPGADALRETLRRMGTTRLARIVDGQWRTIDDPAATASRTTRDTGGRPATADRRAPGEARRRSRSWLPRAAPPSGD